MPLGCVRPRSEERYKHKDPWIRTFIKLLSGVSAPIYHLGPGAAGAMNRRPAMNRGAANQR